MVELEVPLLTDRENPFTVWVREEMFPSAVVIRELNVSAVCYNAEKFPSKSLTWLRRFCAVTFRV